MSNSERRAQTIAIVGAGEMGAAVGQRMRQFGARVVTTLRDRSAASVERVRRASLEVVDDDQLVREAAFLLSIVPPGVAADVAERFRGPMTDAPLKPVFVECNAISPSTVRQIADSLATTGCAFIDGGIIGGPPASGRAGTGPRFYISGPNAHLMTPLRNYGLDISIIDGAVGAASALKMSYAGLTKGMIALGAAMIAGASRDGVDTALREEARSQSARIARDALAEDSGDVSEGASIGCGDGTNIGISWRRGEWLGNLLGRRAALSETGRRLERRRSPRRAGSHCVVLPPGGQSMTSPQANRVLQ